MREESVVDTGLEYAPGDHVVVRVVRREGRTSISDDGAAVERAGRPRGWRDVADCEASLALYEELLELA